MFGSNFKYIANPVAIAGTHSCQIAHVSGPLYSCDFTKRFWDRKVCIRAVMKMNGNFLALINFCFPVANMRMKYTIHTLNWRRKMTNDFGIPFPVWVYLDM